MSDTPISAGDYEDTPRPQALQVPLDRIEDRLQRRLDDSLRRQGERLGEIEDDVGALRQEFAQVRLELVAIHGTNGTNGKIGNLAAAVSDIRDSFTNAAAEQRANRRALYGTGIGLLIAIITGVMVMRERLVSVESDSAHSKESITTLSESQKDRSDRLERRLDQVLDRLDGVTTK